MLMVAGGILKENGLYLIAQRRKDDDYGLRWEFPGGKLDQGETGEICIVRELQEELGIEVEVSGLFMEFIEKGEDFGILYYLVNRVSGKITLNEHEQVQWVPVERLLDYDLLSGDVEAAKKLRHQA